MNKLEIVSITFLNLLLLIKYKLIEGWRLAADKFNKFRLPKKLKVFDSGNAKILYEVLRLVKTAVGYQLRTNKVNILEISTNSNRFFFMHSHLCLLKGHWRRLKDSTCSEYLWLMKLYERNWNQLFVPDS